MSLPMAELAQLDPRPHCVFLMCYRCFAFHGVLHSVSHGPLPVLRSIVPYLCSTRLPCPRQGKISLVIEPTGWIPV
jgi:hypothetical protein